jgi:hypothetical protein
MKTENRPSDSSSESGGEGLSGGDENGVKESGGGKTA